MKIELVIDDKIVDILEQDKEDKQIWIIKSGSWLYSNEVVDYINCIFDDPPTPVYFDDIIDIDNTPLDDIPF